MISLSFAISKSGLLSTIWERNSKMKENEELEDTRALLLRLFLRNCQGSLLDKSDQYYEALLLARVGIVDQAWELSKKVRPIRTRTNLAWDLALQFQIGIGQEDRGWLSPLVSLLSHGEGHLELARFLARYFNKKFRWEAWLEVYKRTKAPQDLLQLRQSLRLAEAIGYEDVLSILVKIAEVCGGIDGTLERVKKYFNRHRECLEGNDRYEELRIAYWKLIAKLEDDPVAKQKARSIAAKKTRRENKRHREMTQTFSGLMGLFRQTGDVSYLDSAVSKIFDVHDGESQVRMIFSAIHEIDSKSGFEYHIRR